MRGAGLLGAPRGTPLLELQDAGTGAYLSHYITQPCFLFYLHSLHQVTNHCMEVWALQYGGAFTEYHILANQPD